MLDLRQVFAEVAGRLLFERGYCWEGGDDEPLDTVPLREFVAWANGSRMFREMMAGYGLSWGPPVTAPAPPARPGAAPAPGPEVDAPSQALAGPQGDQPPPAGPDAAFTVRRAPEAGQGLFRASLAGPRPPGGKPLYEPVALVRPVGPGQFLVQRPRAGSFITPPTLVPLGAVHPDDRARLLMAAKGLAESGALDDLYFDPDDRRLRGEGYGDGGGEGAGGPGGGGGDAGGPAGDAGGLHGGPGGPDPGLGAGPLPPGGAAEPGGGCGPDVPGG